jgi:hypothetical protein
LGQRIPQDQDPDLEFGTFSFSNNPINLANRIKGSSKDCPIEIQDLMKTFEPYDGGNGLLCVLNDMCNLSKHALTTFVAGARAGGAISGDSFTGPIDFFEHLILDPAKNEIPYMRVLKDADPQHEIDLTVFPSLDYRGLMSEEPAVKVLQDMIGEATRIVFAIEGKCRDIGLIK